MLTRLITSEVTLPKIIKKLNGANASNRGAFAACDKLDIAVEVPRQLGASAVVLRINKDGCKDKDYALSFQKTDFVTDEYTLSLDMSALVGKDGCGLFFYEFLFLRGLDTLFTNSKNNVDFSLSTSSQKRFLLLIYSSDFETPKWFRGRIMYHVFVDRFAKGNGPVGKRDDVIINDDWSNGIPQYPEKRGDELDNNMFFGGNLWGVAEKLDYLKELGVGVIYLSPIFEAYSNHKYDTGNYLKIDEMFGGEEAFLYLIKKAKELDIQIMLDGVFNHTGNDSLYFDAKNKYGDQGAYNNPNSPYKDWYTFKEYPNTFESWWGIKILPKLNHKNESCRRFFTSTGGVGEKYIKMGVMGWRLDVVDELPDDFLDEFCNTVKSASDGQAVILGEVWENAAEKIAYGKRRRYFQVGQLDSVMNYPLRNGILSLLIDKNAESLADTLKSVYATYPKSVCDSLMNLLGTHDTERIITVLGEERENNSYLPNNVLATRKLSVKQRKLASQKLKIAATIQYTVYGVPSIFYGDEVGLEGYHDPFCRKPFPWDREDLDILNFYKKLGAIRKENSCIFSEGDFYVNEVENSFISYTRECSGKKIIIAINASDTSKDYSIKGNFINLVDNRQYNGLLEPYQAVILKPLE